MNTALKQDLKPIDIIFMESETSFGIIAKISDDDLKSIQGNMNLSAENRSRVDYEIYIRSIVLPEEWRLSNETK